MVEQWLVAYRAANRSCTAYWQSMEFFRIQEMNATNLMTINTFIVLCFKANYVLLACRLLHVAAWRKNKTHRV